MKIFNKIKGNKGEKIASDYLKKQKYKIIKRNYFSPCGEIDIIAQDRDVMVFVEVKTRTNEKFGFASEAVDFKKQQKIKNAALLYTQNENISAIRFDVIEVYLSSGKLNHIINAF